MAVWSISSRFDSRFRCFRANLRLPLGGLQRVDVDQERAKRLGQFDPRLRHSGPNHQQSRSCAILDQWAAPWSRDNWAVNLVGHVGRCWPRHRVRVSSFLFFFVFTIFYFKRLKHSNHQGQDWSFCLCGQGECQRPVRGPMHHSRQQCPGAGGAEASTGITGASRHLCRHGAAAATAAATCPAATTDTT